MSNETSKSKRKRYTIEPLTISPTEADQLRGVVGRLMGKLPARDLNDRIERSHFETAQIEASKNEITQVRTAQIEPSHTETAQNETAQYEKSQSEKSHERSQLDTAQMKGRARKRVAKSGSVNLSSPESDAPKIMQELPHVEGYLKLYNQVIDYLYPQLDDSEQVIHLQLFRLTWGFGRPTVEINLQTLARRANVSRSTAHRALSRLIGRGLVRVEATIRGAGRDQCNRYYVVPPPVMFSEASDVKSSNPNLSSPDLSRLTGGLNLTPMKEKTQEKSKDTQTQAGVGVSSRFSLEECRRYAEHLKETGQGITNPGGYATTIFRTGEADELIEAWLSAPRAQALDISQCPDCQGLGFLYPNGIEGGVVKCRHDKLKT